MPPLVTLVGLAAFAVLIVKALSRQPARPVQQASEALAAAGASIVAAKRGGRRGRPSVIDFELDGKPGVLTVSGSPISMILFAVRVPSAPLPEVTFRGERGPDLTAEALGVGGAVRFGNAESARAIYVEPKTARDAAGRLLASGSLRAHIEAVISRRFRVCLSQEGISAWGFRRLDRFEASEIFEIKRSLEAIVAEATSAA